MTAIAERDWAPAVRRRPLRSFVPLLQVAPVVIYLILLFVVPVAAILALSFLSDHGSLSVEQYQRLVDKPLYGKVLANTLRTALWTTILCLVGAYPIAFLLANTSKLRSNLLIVFVLMPFWTSFLVRTFAWIVLLGRKGAINQTLQSVHLTDGPLSLMYNFGGVLVGMVHAMMPLAVLTMLAVMVGIDRNLLNAAATMGARAGTRFWRIYFPLSMPGVAASGLLIFITSLGFFITPSLLGGPRDTMIVQLIIFQIHEVLNWRFAGAIGVLLLATFVVIFVIYDGVFGLSTIAGNSSPEARKSSLLGRWSARFGRHLTFLLAAATDAVGWVLRRVFGHRNRRIAGPAADRWPPRIVALTLIGFLALPTFFVIPVSFTSEAFLSWPPTGFSLQWYEEIFHSPVWVAAALRSLFVAFIVALLGMLIAVPCVFALAWQRLPGRPILFAFLISPMIVPHIFIAVGLFFLYSKIGLAGTTLGLILGHAVLAIPYITVTVLAVVKGYDRNLDYAAWLMGASRWRTFRRVTLPVIAAGMAASFMFAFIQSFDELTIAMFVTSGQVTTLPKLMYDDALLSVSPRLAAVATLLLVFMSVVILISEFIRRKSKQRSGAQI